MWEKNRKESTESTPLCKILYKLSERNREGKIKRKVPFLFLIVLFFVVLLDQISKIYMKQLLKSGEIKISKFFSFTFVGNKGILFGLFSEQNINLFLIIISIVVIFSLGFYISFAKESKFLQVSIGFIEGGVIGNLMDRIRYGYVIDFLNFKIWPVFNISDIFIVSGTLLTIFYHLKKNAS